MAGEIPKTVRIASDDAAAVARANAYHALARAFDRHDNWPSELAQLLIEAFEPLGGKLPDIARELAENSKDTKVLSIAHAKLFIGPFEVQVAPWASSYLDPERQLMGPFSRYAAEAYSEAGLAPSDGPVDAPDHVTHELEFMYFLAFQEATKGDKVWHERQERFWREHLSHWLPKFGEAVKQQSALDGSEFYVRLAKLTRAFCDLEAENLGTKPDTSLTTS